MTIQELYDWAVKRNLTNAELAVQYQYGDEEYFGDTFLDGREVDAMLKRTYAPEGKQYVCLW